jgi:glycosyltransferase involved in cell wall biosynthesis
MRILIVHSRYLSGHASGENSVVEDETKLLTEAGHRVQVWQPTPKRVTGLGLARTAIDTTWSRETVDRVRRMLREGRPEIVHFHNLFPMISPAALRVADEEGAVPVMTLHNYRLMCLPATFLRDGRICEDCMGHSPWPGVVHRCYRNSLPGSAALATSLSLHRALRSFNRVALYLPVSEFVRDKYVEAGFPPERLRVKPNFAWPTSTRRGAGHHFLFVGRVSPEKGVRTLIEAWRDIPAKLLIVGDGPDAKRLQGIAPRNVVFTGPVARERVADFLRDARALLLPSLWYEAQPRVIPESYAAGVPVLASRIGGLPDFVVEGRSGFLAPAHDAAGWAEIVGRLSEDAESTRLGEGALRLWNERYSPEKGLQELENSYRDALSRRRKASRPG